MKTKLKTYYHNTAFMVPNNMILGYVTTEGDFISRKDYIKSINDDIALQLFCKIIVEEGLLTCGENYDDFCKRIAKEAFEELNK